MKIKIGKVFLGFFFEIPGALRLLLALHAGASVAVNPKNGVVT
jgi:hypothetical protein